MTALDDIGGWVDKLAIQETINRYSDAVSRGDWDQYEAVLAPDAIWEVAAPFDIKIESARAIRETVSGMLDSYDFLIQTCHNSVIALAGQGRASATSTIHEIGRQHGVRELMQYGIYYDELVKSDNVWKFTSRRFQPIYMESDPLRGQALTSRMKLR